MAVGGQLSERAARLTRTKLVVSDAPADGRSIRPSAVQARRAQSRAAGARPMARSRACAAGAPDRRQRRACRSSTGAPRCSEMENEAAHPPVRSTEHEVVGIPIIFAIA